MNSRLRGAVGLIALAGALALSGCTIPGGSVDDFLENPGPARTPAGSAEPKIDPGKIYRQTEDSVVTVIVDYDGDGSAEGVGSGFAIDRTTIVTNVHVIGDLWKHRKADDVFIQLRDGNRYPAMIAGTDSHADVALLSVDYSDRKVAQEASDAFTDESLAGSEELDLDQPKLKPLEFGDSRRLAVGDQIAAVGSPLGVTDSLAIGFVTGIDRTIPGLAGFNIPGAIQTDAAITLGNSGGPMFDTAGRVVGINNQIATVGGGGEGLAFAIPSEVVEHSVRELERHGKVRYSYLGARTRPVSANVAHVLDLPDRPGVLVFSVRDGSPAAKAGLRGADETVWSAGSEWSDGGDYIVAIDGEPLRRNEKLTALIAARRPGASMRLRVWRQNAESSGGDFRTVTVKLGERPLLWDE